MPKKYLKTSPLRSLRALFIVIASISMVGGSVFVHADQYDTLINNISSQNDQVQASINNLRAAADTYQGAVDLLNNQISNLQDQINASVAKQDSLKQQIDDAQKQIDLQRLYLSSSIKAMYVDGTPTTIEQLATSNNLSDFVDKQEYRARVQDSLNQTLAKITELQKQLQTQKIQVDQLVKDQTDQRAQLASNQASQYQLLNMNQSQQSQYTQQLQSNNSKIAQLRAEQRAAYERAFGGGSNSSSNGTIVYRNLTGQTSCGGNYAYSLCGAYQDSFFDSWGEYNRECVSYAAWYESMQGHYVPTFGNYRGAARGNANQWEGVIRDSGAADIIYGSDFPSSSSVVGDAVYMPIGGVGHMGIVLGTSSEGEGWVRVGQYNIKLTGMYSEMDLKITPNLLFFRFH